VSVGFGVTGGFIGYGIGSLAGWLVAWRFLGRFKRHPQRYPWRDFIAFGLPATLFSICIFLAQSLDLFSVKALLKDDAQAGYYTSAATIARTPFFLFLGISGVLMPSLAKARASNDTEFIRSSLAVSLRYMLLLLLPLVLLVSATSTQVVVLLFSQSYEPAGEALQVLILGIGALSLFMALAYAIMGAFGALVPLAILAPIVVLDGALNLLLTPRLGMVGAATATAVSASLATVLAGWFLLWRVGGILRPWSLVRIGAASGVVYALGYLLPDSPALLVPGYIGIGAAYVAVLFLLRELRGEDVAFVLRTLGLRREDQTAA
jgi:O-antigen/teichoic acid export membrane protein